MDLLVKLYDLPRDTEPSQGEAGASVRRAFAAEKAMVTRWVAQRFGERWASESEAAFARLPVACFVGVADDQLLGFACYDATARGFFGPIGVDEGARHRGVGRVLLLACLHDMAAQGYGYAIIGGAGADDLYRSEVNATPIAGSVPGFYRGMLKG